MTDQERIDELEFLVEEAERRANRRSRIITKACNILRKGLKDDRAWSVSVQEAIDVLEGKHE